ncbi:hypothetical protein SLEP1_g54555 [Rubroshorea leprosula]|uniref:Uncharacterized protein n=1 Tax=Rubroshorea leprosula TaxID=152421 RepID=A0AAV5MCU0_9ROSI|nr:hypothetical protein SLEP1_g54555 [Rubroshorea leprosula]
MLNPYFSADILPYISRPSPHPKRRRGSPSSFHFPRSLKPKGKTEDPNAIISFGDSL